MSLTRYLPALLLLAAVPAQTPLRVTLPAWPAPPPPPPPWSANNYPLAGPVMRYQQWFPPSQLSTTVKHPVRIVGMDFIAGSPGGQTGAQVDLEITLANGPAVQPSGLLDQNLQSGTVVVVPQGKFLLGTATPGTYPLSFNFKTFGREFTWDGVSALVVDVKLFSNGKPNNTPYTYDLQSTVQGVGKVWRLWGLGTDPRTITMASFNQNGSGLALRFTWEEGVTVPYGSGCPGAGGFVPVASTTGGHPLPANAAWTQVLGQARSQVPAVLLIGGDRTVWGAYALPLDLTIVGAPGCFLLNDVLVTINATTVGGGPGTGAASINLPIPPVTIFFGQPLYTQWLVWDNQAANAVLAMSNGLWSIFG